jgi:phage tail sheath protein FI
MPVAYTYPGVYIEELTSGVRTITGVPTSITAFIGRALRGPDDRPVRVQSFAEFDRAFGGLWRGSPMTYAVYHFFLNGGSDALIVRIVKEGKVATGSADKLKLEAASPGKWGEKLRVRVDHDTKDPKNDEAIQLFNLTVRHEELGITERFLNVSSINDNPRFITKVLSSESNLIRVAKDADLSARPAITSKLTDENIDPMTGPPGSIQFNTDGNDGKEITSKEVVDPGLQKNHEGLWLLEKEDLFNLLCIPPFSFQAPGDIDKATRDEAANYCEFRRAMFIVDPLSSWKQPSDLTSETIGLDSSEWGLHRSKNAALYFPNVRMPDPLQEGRLADFAPCGAVAGVITRTDANRGVWKAPAGIEATLNGVAELTVKLTDGQNGLLNPLGVNCLRAFPVTGRVVWGARTLRGADQLADEWKYKPVRRTALFIEESLYRGTQWVVFEPNDEPLWAQIRLNVGAFMQTLFRQGAFQGRTPREAYLVKCDRDTTTQNHINLGIVNILVGFAPLKPAEFVVIKIQQLAGQVEA